MRVLYAFLLFALSHTPGFASSQPAPGVWHMVLGTETAAVAESTERGYPALPASALLSVGARLSYGRGEVIVQWGPREIRLRPDSPGALVDGRPLMMANPVYQANGIVYLPADFFSAILPQAAPGLVSVDAGNRTVRADPAVLAAASAVPAPVAEASAPVAMPQPAPPPRRRLVVIDAGHGGRDPGARGQAGTREKDINLQVARRVVEILRQDTTLEVRLTRNSDTLIALRDRPRMAARWRDEGQPALFMSIHCNAHPSRGETGYETYFLAEARTAESRRVQEMEDAAQQYEDDAPGGGSGDALGFIMSDLRQNQHLRESSDWAQMIQDRLREVHPGPSRGVKQAGFAVLVGATMPAVLVELGFISNRNEEQMLADPRQQDTLARQLAAGVQDFFRATDRRQSRAGN
ncbi:N-acetylmuramoyl-L-alanine amidase [Longimicrobium sp.]|uniref:N-acetylmuramoyl-L-alanine amidase n=1 Tax=Longimicrobium sp. TaxID=2029185 RepID=UPI002E363BC4|nr:N-acetylmuramoyl-L-alanine amidase [Longimicrobium sp.]HEX6037360.1 N-acetylmuramoyl-L-alanine amidase [Longimicrobium sp.]